MDSAKTPAAFNEWMRRYIEEPERFSREFEEVLKFKAEGEQPSYGDRCVAYLGKLMAEQAA